MAKSVKTESVSRGQKIVSSYGRDNSNFKSDGTSNGEMGGSVTNLAATLSGGSAHQDGTGHGKKNKFD